MKKIFISVFIYLIAINIFSATFDFYLPWDDSTQNIIDLSKYNHKPAGVSGYVQAGSDGHLYVGGERIKFLGVNFTGGACMPQKEDAEKIAKRLAKFGINLVRFHALDAGWGLSIIDYSLSDTRHFNAANLDRFDYFFAKLKENGIYADINLLVGRNFKSGDGLPASIDSMDWKDKQTPAMFNSTMIDLQKEYANNLLTHVNPYTSLAYKDDPAVAFVEVCNEHGLLHAWLNGQIDKLPQEFSDELKVKWNDFLKNKYSTHENLRNNWVITTPEGPEIIINGDFSTGAFSPWNTEQHNEATANFSVTNEGPSGINTAKIEITNTGVEGWYIQLNQGGFLVNTGTVYTLSFSAKANTLTSISVDIGQAHDPWQLLGFKKSIDLNTTWQDFTYRFTLTQGDSNARLNFSDICDENVTVWITNVSLKEGGEIGLFPDENLDNSSIRVFYLNEKGERTYKGLKDWSEFLWNLEYDYWNTMNSYLKNTIGIHALTIGTVIGNSTPNIMKLFDVIDSHNYWEHPVFPVNPWQSPWYVENKSVLGEKNGGTIGELGVKRVYNKPFTVSEYNHPFPNNFESEAYIILSTYAALNDWDGIFPYTYSDGKLNWSDNQIDGYFGIGKNPAKMISLIHAFYIFRRGDIKPSDSSVYVNLTKNDEINNMPSAYPWILVDGETKGLDKRASLIYKTGVVVEGDTPPVGAIDANSISINSNTFISSTQELTWNADDKVLIINSLKTKGVVGKIIGKNFDLNGINITPQSAIHDFANIILSLVDGDILTNNAKTILLTSFGLCTNSNIQYAIFPDTPVSFPPPEGEKISLLSWGESPVIVDGIVSDIIIPYLYDHVKVFALSNYGDRKISIPITSSNGNAKFTIDNYAYKTLWYEIAIYDTPPPTDTYTITPTFTITPGGPTLTPTSTNTFTPVPSTIIIDDCEDDDNINFLGGYWYDYCDSESTINPSPSSSFIMNNGGANGTDFSVRIYGYLAPYSTPDVYPYAAVQTDLDAASGSPTYKEIDISKYSGIQFFTKGDNNQYFVKIPYTNSSGETLTGWNDYKYTFTAPSNWTFLKIPFSSFTQDSGWGTIVPLSDVLTHAKNIQWQVDGFGRNFDLWIDEVAFFITETISPTPTVFNTSTPTYTPTQNLYKKKLQKTVNNVYVYPSLYKKSYRTKGIYFKNLPVRCHLYIYNLYGEIIFEKEILNSTGEYLWKVKRKITAGIYIYVFIDEHKNIKKGKLVIIN